MVCDHIVFILDVSTPMHTQVQVPSRSELHRKLQLVLQDLMQLLARFKAVNRFFLFDIMWFDGTQYGAWQLDPDAWGEVSGCGCRGFRVVGVLLSAVVVWLVAIRPHVC